MTDDQKEELEEDWRERTIRILRIIEIEYFDTCVDPTPQQDPGPRSLLSNADMDELDEME